LPSQTIEILNNSSIFYCGRNCCNHSSRVKYSNVLAVRFFRWSQSLCAVTHSFCLWKWLGFFNALVWRWTFIQDNYDMSYCTSWFKCVLMLEWAIACQVLWNARCIKDQWCHFIYKKLWPKNSKSPILIMNECITIDYTLSTSCLFSVMLMHYFWSCIVLLCTTDLICASLIIGNKEKQEAYNGKALVRKLAIDDLFWKDDIGAWSDMSLDESKAKTDFYPSNIFPLFANCTNLDFHQPSMAQKVLNYVKVCGFVNLFKTIYIRHSHSNKLLWCN